jgi:ribosomal protein S18 acetylase RimI-like enzyme
VQFQLVADNLRESFRVVAASRAGGELRELHGASIASAGATFQMFNAAFLAKPVATEAELAQRILLASMHFQNRGQEWAYWVCEDWIEGRLRKRSRRIFERHGLRLSTELPGMIAEQVLPPVKPLPRLDVRRVCNDAERERFCEIGSVCFHVPIPWFREVFDSERVWEQFAAYVGYAAGRAVSTAAVVAGGGAIGVYNVATLPDEQRSGFGESVMRYALKEGLREHGAQPVILQSTPAGLRLYQRMGFRTVAKVAVYSS